MIDKAIGNVESADLDRLVANEVREGRSLEYKAALPGGTDGDRREFLSDVSSFANAVGGDLIYGAVEGRDDRGDATGLLARIQGLEAANVDQTTQRLENLLRDGIAPRIAGVRFRWVEGFKKGPALVVRIPRSWLAPHMVVFQQLSRFYSRNENGKYILDVAQLREAFLQQGSFSQRANEFRSERLGRLVADDTPMQLVTRKVICVHIVPHSSFAGVEGIDLERAAKEYALIYPFGSTGFTRCTFNIDGLLSYAASASGPAEGYFQVFRNGMIETVDARSIQRRLVADVGDGVGWDSCRRDVLALIDRVRQLYTTLSIEPPVSIFVSLLDVKGTQLFVHPELCRRVIVSPFDRDLILLPGVVDQDFNQPSTAVVRPAFDALWQAIGFPRCLDFDESGVWRPMR